MIRPRSLPLEGGGQVGVDGKGLDHSIREAWRPPTLALPRNPPTAGRGEGTEGRRAWSAVGWPHRCAAFIPESPLRSRQPTVASDVMPLLRRFSG